jgi:hypothetical protein
MAVQAQAVQEVDRREIIAIIRAVAKARKFAVWYSDIYDELSAMIESDDEFHRLENKLYEDIAEGRIRHVYRVGSACDDSDCDIIVVAPGELSARQLEMLRELAQLYQFARWDASEDRDELDAVMHNLVKMWFSGCTKAASPAETIYTLARAYSLKIEEDSRLSDFDYRGSIYYGVEGLGVRLEKRVDYCNHCVDFPDASQSFVEKCTVWRFEGEGESG